jgi:hypothetical protein
MSAGIVQLLARGAQDEYITGNPEVTFFRSQYKRHTPFSMFTSELKFQGIPYSHGMSTIKVEKHGDMVNYIYLSIKDKLTNRSVIINDWSRVVKYSELIINGQIVDTQDSIFTEYVAVDTLSQTYSRSGVGGAHTGRTGDSYFYPFRFFFCENWQYSLPLFLMNNCEVEIRVYWNDDVDYIHECHANFFTLSDEDRKNISDPNKHDMLITQVQKSIPSNTTKQEVDFSHPVKFIASPNINNDNNLLDEDATVFIEMNGIELATKKNCIPHYSAIQTYYHTDYSPGNENTLFMVPFCISSNRAQPTGTLNFSRLDSFTINCSKDITTAIYGVNYNILRIRNGVCVLLYYN